MNKDDLRDARELCAALGTGVINSAANEFEERRIGDNYRKLTAKLATMEVDDEPRPTIERIERNGPATIAFWSDGTKTVTTRRDEPEDAEKAFAVLIAKKFYKGWYSDFKRMGKGIVDIHGIRLSEGDGFALVDAYGVPDNYLRIAKRIFWSDEKHSWGVEYSHPRHIGNITQYACDTSFEIEITPEHLNPNKQTRYVPKDAEINVTVEVTNMMCTDFGRRP